MFERYGIYFIGSFVPPEWIMNFACTFFGYTLPVKVILSLTIVALFDTSITG